MVKVAVKFRPGRGSTLPEWLHSKELDRGGYVFYIDIEVPYDVNDPTAHIETELRSKLADIEGLGDITYLPINNNNNNNNMDNLMNALKINRNKNSKRITRRKKVIGYKPVFGEKRGRSRTRHNLSNLVPGSAMDVTARASGRSKITNIRKAAIQKAETRLKKALNSNSMRSNSMRSNSMRSNSMRSRSAKPSKIPMLDRPPEERIATIQHIVKKWHQSLLKKARPEHRGRSRSRMRVNGVTIPLELEREWEIAEINAQRHIDDIIHDKARQFYRNQLEKYKLDYPPYSTNTSFLFT